jgi:excinuclease ABC subunit C
MKEFDPRPELKNIPQKPGIYQFWSETEELIYIGKAKNSKKQGFILF